MGVQPAPLLAVRRPEQPSEMAGPASGLLSRTADSRSIQAGSRFKKRGDCSPLLNQLPGEIAPDKFVSQGADFTGVIGLLLISFAADQFAGYGIDPNVDLPRAAAIAVPPRIRTCCTADWLIWLVGYAIETSSTGVFSCGPWGASD